MLGEKERRKKKVKRGIAVMCLTRGPASLVLMLKALEKVKGPKTVWTI